MFSQTSEYALRAVVELAIHSNTPLTTQQIAETTKIPAGYLSKVLQSLGRSNLVRSQRGLHGGYLLTRSPETITVLDVVNAVDPIQRITCCPLDLKEHGDKLCPLHQKMDTAIGKMEESLGGSTIADMLPKPESPVS
ncbi:MAG: Rrf2 family transcriptional regulator [Spirochaetes bacterium]|nr:Rrf2 family transcriptional regulator [Spirochaetota bacterium]